MSEVFGIYEKTLFRDIRTANTYFSLRVSEEVAERNKYGCIVCSAYIPDYTKGIPLFIKGEWKITSKGKLLEVPKQDKNTPENEKMFVREEARSEAMAAEYLSSGICKGIGYSTAREIVNKFGENIFDFLSKEGAAETISNSIPRIKLEKAIELCENVKSTIEQRKIYEFISDFGGFYTTALKLYKEYGSYALNKIKKEPYIVGMKSGLTFLQCDEMAKSVGIHPANIERIKALASTCIKQECMQGHVFVYQNKLCDRMKKILNHSAYSDFEISNSILMTGITKNNELVVEEGFLNRVYLKYLKLAETNIAIQIKRLNETGKQLDFNDKYVDLAEKECGISYAPQQRESFGVLKKTGVSIITGGPGTGKTTTINGIINAYEKMYPQSIIKLCAPTGRAAQRMTESTGREAVTIHRLLDYKPYGNDVIYKDANNPIDADFVVVDEGSMFDVELASIFFSAIKSGTLVLIVGDVNQLPSVGPGDVLNDLIKSECIPVFKLATVYRQQKESPIVVNANRINIGEKTFIETENFEIAHIEQDEEMLKLIIKSVKKHFSWNDPFDTQVLSPTHKGEAGVAKINAVLQKLLNPPKTGEAELRYGNKIYRKNDKVIMLSNNYDMGYYNGDLGIVVNINNTSMDVKILDKRITIGREIMDDVNLAYAMTIHKSQGSEFKNVIISLPKNPVSMLKRNLLYTAVTRAKNNISIIAQYGALKEAVEKCDTGKRNTKLSKKMQNIMTAN